MNASLTLKRSAKQARNQNGIVLAFLGRPLDDLDEDLLVLFCILVVDERPLQFLYRGDWAVRNESHLRPKELAHARRSCLQIFATQPQGESFDAIKQAAAESMPELILSDFDVEDVALLSFDLKVRSDDRGSVVCIVAEAKRIVALDLKCKDLVLLGEARESGQAFPETLLQQSCFFVLLHPSSFPESSDQCPR